MKICPADGLWTPDNILISVDLPAPLSPSKQQAMPPEST